MPGPNGAVAPGRRSLLAAALAGVGSLPTRPRAAAAQAIAWPERRVRLITPAAPGSSLDLVSRVVAERLAVRWGQPVVVEGRTGADGVPALEAMLTASPGEALLLANHGVVTVTPILHPRLGFDPLVEFPPLARLTVDQFGLAVPAPLSVHGLADLVSHARDRPGTLNWTAPAGPPYLAMRAFLREADLDMTFVGYRGVGAATIGEMLAGRLHVIMAPLAPVVGAAREGKLRVVAITGPERAPALPEVPTSAEQGFPGFRQEGIHGLFAWRGMSGALQARIASDAAAAVSEPALAERLRGAGVLVRADGAPAAFAALLGEQRGRWTALARDFGTEPPS